MTADWMTDAACRDYSPDLWFARSYDAAQDARDTTAAIRICWDYEAREAYLRAAMAREGTAGRHGRHGVVGGLRAGQRATLARRQPGVKAARVPLPCPSAAAYDRHRAKGETCEACTKAASAYRRSRRQVRAAA